MIQGIIGKFPHHSTANQFFTEDLFDAYCAVGALALRDALGLEV